MLTELGWGTAELAKAAGVSHSTAGRWMCTENTTSSTTQALGKVCAATGYSPAWLLMGIGPRMIADLERVHEISERLGAIEKALAVLVDR